MHKPVNEIESFKKICSIIDTLLGPEGCPWDKKQTLESLKPHLNEELHELFDAIDANNETEIVEELGDLFWGLLFMARIGEKNERFSLHEVFTVVSDKLIRRHPHIFLERRADISADEVYDQWQQIKAQEAKGRVRKSALDRIPKAIPTLVRAQKVAKIAGEAKGERVSDAQHSSEEEIGEALWAIIEKASKSHIDADSALRKVVKRQEEEFRRSEGK